MVEPIGNINGSAPPAPSRGPAEWASEALSWASPGGLVMHATQPIIAEALRTSGVGKGTEWGASLQRIVDDPRAIGDFQLGFAKGMANGAKGLIEGAWGLAKGVASLAYNESPLGHLADFARGHGVAVPDWAPSAERIEAPMRAVASGIADYVGDVQAGRANPGDDVKAWVGAHWAELKADHAAAAAQGGAAEAQWWGQIAGRATFEVAALVVPATKFATVAKAGEALEIGIKAGKLGETLLEASRAGKLGELFGAAGKAGKLPELIAEARTAGRLPELIAEARKTSGGLEAIAGKGGLSYREIGAAEALGTLSKADAYTMRAANAVARLGPQIDEASRLTGLPRDQIVDIMAKAKVDRPLPSSYLSDDAIRAHLGKFDEGAVRITTADAVRDYGTIGAADGGFVIPFKEFRELTRAANGSAAVLETKLGLDAGTLAKGGTRLFKIEPGAIDNLRMASGRETGANAWWIPGGYTSGGMSEAVINFPAGIKASELHLTIK